MASVGYKYGHWPCLYTKIYFSAKVVNLWLELLLSHQPIPSHLLLCEFGWALHFSEVMAILVYQNDLLYYEENNTELIILWCKGRVGGNLIVIIYLAIFPLLIPCIRKIDSDISIYGYSYWCADLCSIFKMWLHDYTTIDCI